MAKFIYAYIRVMLIGFTIHISLIFLLTKLLLKSLQLLYFFINYF